MAKPRPKALNGKWCLPVNALFARVRCALPWPLQIQQVGMGSFLSAGNPQRGLARLLSRA